jgi:GT2 family glycosyltransferase
VNDLHMPFISIVIPHYNDLENLERCLIKLRRQTWPKNRFEIIVADNNSVGGVAAVERIAPDVRVVPAVKQGAGPARNAGVGIARGDILAFIDSDCFANETWLEEGSAALRHFDYVGGEVVITVANAQHVSLAEAYEIVFGFNFKKYIEEDKFSGSGNLFVPRSIFDKVGGFRSTVSEDVDWCWRANAMGFRLGYAAKAVVCHSARHEWVGLIRKWDRVISETIALNREQAGWRLRWLIRAAGTLLSPIPHAPRVILCDRLLGFRNKAAGLVGLCAIRAYRSYRMLTSMKGI